MMPTVRVGSSTAGPAGSIGELAAKKIGHVMGLDPRRQAARRFTVCHQDGCMMP
jgi:hypothetical protein